MEDGRWKMADGRLKIEGDIDTALSYLSSGCEPET